MTKRQFYSLLIVAITVIALGVMLSYVSIKAQRTRAEIEADAMVREREIIEESKKKRAEIHLQWLPWNKERSDGK